MHVSLVVRKRLPRRKPNLVVYQGERLAFKRWEAQTMVFEARGVRVEIVTRKLSDMRFVKAIRCGDAPLASIDAYRIGRPRLRVERDCSSLLNYSAS